MFIEDYHQKILMYKGKKILTYSFGKGDKVVLTLPSYPQSGLTYICFANYHNHDKLKFITFDLPGWIGNSENVFEENSFSMDEFINIAKEVLKLYEVNKFSVLGYSFGGALAVKIASEMKDRILKVVLVSTIINGDLIKKSNVVNLINMAKRFSANKVLEMYCRERANNYLVNYKKENLSDTYIEYYKDMIKNMSGKILLDSIYELFHTNYTEDLKALKDFPILVVNSKDEAEFFRIQAKHIREILDDKKSIYLHGSHEDFLLKPKEKFIVEILDFLNK